jgi:hypothetical protein
MPPVSQELTAWRVTPTTAANSAPDTPAAWRARRASPERSSWQIRATAVISVRRTAAGYGPVPGHVARGAQADVNR